MNEIIAKTQEFVKNIHDRHDSAHDFFHIQRVYNLACKISETEDANKFIVEMAALLHDAEDVKLGGGTGIVADFLRNLDILDGQKNLILQIVQHVGFRKNLTENKFDCIELQIVQDADMLDAMGAIGIARTFAYGGKKNRPMYDPALKPQEDIDENYNSQTALSHFPEKLFKLKGMLHTDTGKKIGENRHAYLENFYTEFLAEWNGEK